MLCVARLRTSPSLVPPRLCIPGLDVDRRYHVERILLPGDEVEHGPVRRQNDWPRTGIELRGHDLSVIGLQLPVLNPESAIILHLQVADGS